MIQPILMWVVVTTNALPSHFPVENPDQVWGAYSEGCGRPSIQIVRGLPYVPLDGVRNNFAGIRIVRFRNADVAGLPAHRVSDDMRNALTLVRCEHGLVPAFGFEARRFIDGQTGVIADFDTLT